MFSSGGPADADVLLRTSRWAGPSPKIITDLRTRTDPPDATLMFSCRALPVGVRLHDFLDLGQDPVVLRIPSRLWLGLDRWFRC